MSVAKESIRKSTGRFNSPTELWGCTNSPRYHVDRFQDYRNFPNKRYPDVADCAKQSIQEYTQLNSAMGVKTISQGGQYGRGRMSSTTTCSMFA